MSFPVWAALALLSLEYVSLGIAFDSEPLSQRLDGWGVAGPLGALAVVVVCAVLGVALVIHLSGSRVRQLLVARHLDGRTWTILAIHAVAVCALWWLSAHIFAPEGPPRGQPFVWLVLWGSAAAATMLSALTAALPATSWSRSFGDPVRRAREAS